MITKIDVSTYMIRPQPAMGAQLWVSWKHCSSYTQILQLRGIGQRGKWEVGHSLLLHIPTTRCFHSIPSRRAAKQEQALLDSPPTATGASHMDPLRCIGTGYLSVPMQSIPVARRGFKHAGQVNTQQAFVRTSQIRGDLTRSSSQIA